MDGTSTALVLFLQDVQVPESTNALGLILATIIGPVVSFVTSWLKERTWPDGLKVLATAGVSVVFAILVSLVEGRLVGDGWGMTRDEFLANLGVVFMSATAFYHSYFKNGSRDEKLTDGGPVAWARGDTPDEAWPEHSEPYSVKRTSKIYTDRPPSSAMGAWGEELDDG